jgi:2'-5' RNA ligase
MNGLVAIDVAILPPQPIADLAIRLSAALPPAESKGLVLGGTHRPHITLTQQFVPAAEIDIVRHTVATVLKGRAPFALRVRGPGRGAGSVWMRIEPSAELAHLHRALMDALRPFERCGATATAFSGGDPRPGDLKWVAGFRRQSSYGQFAPHITLGHASEPPHVDPIAFTAETVALCHLGRFCTCREVLQSWTLGSR